VFYALQLESNNTEGVFYIQQMHN